jgi:hypothetical protein
MAPSISVTKVTSRRREMLPRIRDNWMCGALTAGGAAEAA